MTLDEIYDEVVRAMEDPGAPLIDRDQAGEYGAIIELVNKLIQQKHRMEEDNLQYTRYIRDKVDQLLTVIGTSPLLPEELDNKTLISVDPIGIVAQSFDQVLNHLRRTNNRLELAMDEIKAIFEAVGGGIMVLDNEGKIISCNQKFSEMFVGEDQDPSGKSCIDVVCQGNKPAKCPHQEMMATGKTSFQPDWHHKGHYLNVVASPVKNKQGQVVSSVILYTDVAQLKHAENKLAEEKERLRITLRNIAEGVITTDVDGKVMLLNKTAETLTGWTQEEAKGKTLCDVLWLVKEESRNDCLNLTSETLKTGEVVLDKTSNIILVGRDGEERWVTLNSSSIEDKDGEIIGVVIAFRDITTERRMETEVQNARKIESLGVLAGGIAHDFNNILTGIMGNISFAQKMSAPDSQVTGKLSMAEKACLRAQNLTQQLLTFSKGGAPIRKTASVKELLKETTLFSLRGSNVKCNIEIDDDLGMVDADLGQLSQVINNLVINADQAMPGGGLLTINARNVMVEPGNEFLLAAGDYIAISVADTGCGIAPEIEDKLFDPYFTTKAKGNGLGLASSYAIVKKHEGHLTVKSEPGSGAEFIIYLPAAGKSEPVETVGENSEPSADLGGLRVLVMDDEEMIVNLVKDMLEEVGCHVEIAASGEEAIKSFQREKEAGSPFDVVILDLTVPGAMGGEDAMTELLKIDPDVKAIVSSGYSSDAIMSSYRDYGFKGVVPKPYEIGQLLQVVEQIARPD